MGNHVRIQHYVPQFILKNFSSKGGKSIWCYDKKNVYHPKDKIKERSIKYVGYEDYFYDENYKCEEGSYEYFLRDIENDVSPIIERIIKTKIIKDLTKKERDKLSFFICLQFFRTKGELIKTDYELKLLEDELKTKVGIEIEKVDSREIWFSLLKESKKFSKIFSKKVWCLSISDESFYISDNPITIQNIVNKSEIYGTMGLDSYGIEIYFPISPSITICLFCDKFFEDKGYDKKYLDNIVCDSENVINLNYLQIVNSTRFVFSHKNDFHLYRN